MEQQQQLTLNNQKLLVLDENINIYTTAVELKPLDETASNAMVADILKVEPEDSIPLTKFLLHFTKGNPHYVKEMLRLMHQHGVLLFDEETKSWNCDENRMKLVYHNKGFHTLTINTFNHLSPQVRDMLKVGACLGNTLHTTFLDIIMAQPVAAYVESALVAGLLSVVDKENSHFSFVNMGVRDVIYSLIPEKDRKHFHLTIGRKLLKALDKDQLQKSSMFILDQIKCGSESMVRKEDQYATATLCLRTAEQSVNWPNFTIAAEWLNFAIHLLGDRSWTDEYELSLTVYNMAAEVAYTVGDMTLVFDRVEIVLRNAREFNHKLQAYSTKINALNVSTRMDEALDLGLNLLSLLGEPLHSNPSAAYVAYQYIRMKRFMKRRPPETLLRLPTMTNNLKAIAMQICSLLAAPAFWKRPYLCALLAFQAVRITISHGLCAVSAVAFGIYGMVLVVSPGNELLVNQYAKLSLELLEHFDTKQWLPRVYMITYGSIMIWNNDVATSLKPLQRGYLIGMETGDYEFALLCKIISCVYNFFLGTPLQIVKQEMDSFTAEVIRLNQPLMEYTHKNWISLIESLIEGSHVEAFDQKLLDDSAIWEAAFGIRFKCWVVFKRLLLSYMLCDYARAALHADKIKDLSNMKHSHIDVAIIILFDALARIAFCGDSRKIGRKSLDLVRRRLSVIKHFSRRNPRFCLGMQLFIEAELDALKGRHETAAGKYLSCTSIFTCSKVLHLQAMSCERAGKFMLQRGKRDSAQDYLVQSCQAFHEWGAIGKSRTLGCDNDLLFGI